MRDFLSTLRKHERELRLSRAATIGPTGSDLVVGFSHQVHESASVPVLSGVPSAWSVLAELYATSVGRGGRQ
jgi:hypothetical protein